MHKIETSWVDVWNGQMKDPVTSDSPVDHSSRLGRRRWKSESKTSYVWHVEWLSRWRWLTEDPDDLNLNPKYAISRHLTASDTCLHHTAKRADREQFLAVPLQCCRRQEGERSPTLIHSRQLASFQLLKQCTFSHQCNSSPQKKCSANKLRTNRNVN